MIIFFSIAKKGLACYCVRLPIHSVSVSSLGGRSWGDGRFLPISLVTMAGLQRVNNIRDTLKRGMLLKSLFFLVCVRLYQNCCRLISECHCHVICSDNEKDVRVCVCIWRGVCMSCKSCYFAQSRSCIASYTQLGGRGEINVWLYIYTHIERLANTSAFCNSHSSWNRRSSLIITDENSCVWVRERERRANPRSIEYQ